jgi:hypothetical protein
MFKGLEIPSNLWGGQKSWFSGRSIGMAAQFVDYVTIPPFKLRLVFLLQYKPLYRGKGHNYIP